MSASTWKEFYSEFISKPIIEFQNSVLEIKLLFITLILAVKNPVFLVFEQDIEKDYLSAARTSKTLSKLLFFFITIEVIFSFGNSVDSFSQLIAEYFIFFSYIVSLIIVLLFSYIFNLLGNYRFDKTKITSNSLVYMFNVIYLTIVLFNILNISQTFSYKFFYSFGIFYSIYFIIRIGKKMNYSFFGILLSSALAVFLISILITINRNTTLSGFKEIIEKVEKMESEVKSTKANK